MQQYWRLLAKLQPTSLCSPPTARPSAAAADAGAGPGLPARYCRQAAVPTHRLPRRPEHHRWRAPRCRCCWRCLAALHQHCRAPLLACRVPAGVLQQLLGWPGLQEGSSLGSEVRTGQAGEKASCQAGRRGGKAAKQAGEKAGQPAGRRNGLDTRCCVWPHAQSGGNGGVGGAWAAGWGTPSASHLHKIAAAFEQVISHLEANVWVGRRGAGPALVALPGRWLLGGS